MVAKPKTPAVVAAPHAQLIRDVESFITSYVTFPDTQSPFVLALWTLATYLWPSFDAFPYLVITSDTKRSGKTRLSELLGFAASNTRSMAGMTAATMFRSIRDENPTIIVDEAEALSSESADMMRAVLNVGYRRGQTIPRMNNGVIEEWPAYCPKVFVLIGDVFDTLRDRSIIVRMRRGQPGRRFLYEPAKLEGNDLGAKLKETADELGGAILDLYMSSAGLTFLQDRDEEIWMPIFAAASIVCPDRMDELTRAAVDMATMKTQDVRRHTELQMREAEREASDIEYAERLLQDLQIVLAEKKIVFTADAITLLFALPTGPWRKFRGDGLTPVDMANLLSRFGVKPRLVRSKGGRSSKVARGYRLEDITKALEQLTK
jgi:hypothetical protein